MEEKMSVSVDYKKRVLEAGDKTEMLEKGQVSFNNKYPCSRKEQGTQDLKQMITDDRDDSRNSAETDITELERQARTRRSREAKKRKENQLDALENKRAKREIRKYDQQNKQELDNEVAKINENNRSFLNKYENGRLEKRQDSADNIRNKSENDIIIVKEFSKKTRENSRLSRNLSENHVTKQSESIDILDADCKAVKTPETSQKDSDKSIPRQLSLESPEKTAERLIQQTTKKEKYAGTLKSEVRIEKKRKKDKRRSRSLKKKSKRSRRDREGYSPESFYIIVNDSETSDREDSNSDANRKFSANHKHSSDEDNEDTAPKDRQSLVIPEKSSSFSIHPGRLCADVCCYCFVKFGSLETPMHLAQMKSDERRQRILNIERHLTKDSCLCDACYRHVDRMAYISLTDMQRKRHRKLMAPRCSASECKDAAQHLVKRRWLLKIKAGLEKQVDIDWESSQHSSMSFCASHHSIIERLLSCALCKHRLRRHHIYQLADAETDVLNRLHQEQQIPVILESGSSVCKLCRYFIQLQLKYKDIKNVNKNHKSFFRSYRERVLHYDDIVVLENEDEDSTQNQTKGKEKDKDRRKKTKRDAQPKAGTSKSPDGTTNSVSEKSIPEPTKNEGPSSKMDNDNRTAKANSNDENVATDLQFHSIESTEVKLEDRKLLDMQPYKSGAMISCGDSNLLVDLLAMDKEVALVRLPKRSWRNKNVAQVIQRFSCNPSISVRMPLPCKEEMDLHDNIEFTNDREIMPEGWANCDATIQCDRDTKFLLQELMKPYWHMNFFLKHLVLLEKNFRSGNLVLAPNASQNDIDYLTSVQNRLIACGVSGIMEGSITEPIASEYHNSRRLSGGYVLERDKHSLPSSSTPRQPSFTSTTQSIISSSPQVLKLNPGLSIMTESIPNLQRRNLPSISAGLANAHVWRRGGHNLSTSPGGMMIRLCEPAFTRLQILIGQLEMLMEKLSTRSNMNSARQYQNDYMPERRKIQKLLRKMQHMSDDLVLLMQVINIRKIFNESIFAAIRECQAQISAIVEILQSNN